MPIETPRFRKWQAAELAAQAVEADIRRRLLECRQHRRTPEMDEELAFARELRRDAHRLFLDAMQEMELAALALQHRVLIASQPDRHRDH